MFQLEIVVPRETNPVYRLIEHYCTSIHSIDVTHESINIDLSVNKLVSASTILDDDMFILIY